MNEVTDLGSVLSEMGQAAEQIAATLRAAGIQGVRNTVRFLNPIVRYCQNHVRVDNYALDIMQAGILRLRVGKSTHEFYLPAPVVAFLDAFNAGAYPDLELPPEAARP